MSVVENYDHVQRMRLENIERLRLQHEEQVMAADKPALSEKQRQAAAKAAAAAKRRWAEEDAAKKDARPAMIVETAGVLLSWVEEKNCGNTSPNTNIKIKNNTTKLIYKLT